MRARYVRGKWGHGLLPGGRATPATGRLSPTCGRTWPGTSSTSQAAWVRAPRARPSANLTNFPIRRLTLKVAQPSPTYVELAHARRHREARFMDVIERALSNGINSGMTLDGTLYCYRNPLESTGEKIRTRGTTPPAARPTCSAPSPHSRVSLQHQHRRLTFTCSTLDARLEARRRHSHSGHPGDEYPWEGEVTMTVNPASASGLHLLYPYSRVGE